MLNKLIKKDFGLCRLALLLVLGTVVLAYSVSLMLSRGFTEVGVSLKDGFAIWLGGGAELLVVLERIPFAILGAAVASKEYEDRSAEFLAYLPPSRIMILLSKWIVAFGTGAAVYWFAFSARHFSTYLVTDPATIEEAFGFMPDIFVSAVAAFCMLSVAIGTAPIVKSSGASAFAGIFATVPLTICLQQTKHYWNWPSPENENTVFVVLAIVQGLLFLALGAIYFVRDRK